MHLDQASALTAILIEHEGYDGDGHDMAKAGGVWVVALDASSPNEWVLTINGERVNVSHGMTRVKLRERGLVK